MPIDYDIVARCWRRNKSALTRAHNKNDPIAVLTACLQASRDFEAHGYPDRWAIFKVAYNDAIYQLGREIRL